MAWDALWVGFVAFALLALGAPRPGGPEAALTLAATCAVIALLAASYCGLYRLPVLGRPHPNIRRVAVVAGLVMPTLWIGARWITAAPPSLPTSLLCAMGVFAVMTAARITSAQIARVPVLRHRVLFIGTGELSYRLMAALDAAGGIGLEVVGVLSSSDADIIGSRRVIGRVEDLPKVLSGSRIQRVIVAEPSVGVPLPMDLLVAAKMSGVPIESGLRLEEALSERVPLRELRPEDIVFEDGFAPRRSYGILSRAVDIASAITGLLIFGPLLLVAMLAIRIESAGPAIFWQVRTGRGNRTFSVCKLRSMRDDAETQSGAVFASGADGRVTKVGRILRMTRIDELPQLWNVLKGEMSLVGPRPERPEFVDELRETYPYFSLRHAVRPGITGLAQIRVGYVSDIAGWGPKLAHDLYYVKHRSLRLDLDIVLGTTRTVLLMRGV